MARKVGDSIIHREFRNEDFSAVVWSSGAGNQAEFWGSVLSHGEVTRESFGSDADGARKWFFSQVDAYLDIWNMTKAESGAEFLARG